jgi:sorting nexin-4
MENDDFSNVSWQSDRSAHNPESGIINPRTEVESNMGGGNLNGKTRGSDGPLGRNADALDLAGVGDGSLECTVTSPIKENDGSKDAYVSYLVTTHVGCYTSRG